MDYKRVTLSEVAKHAGVSPMTVSRVINREGNVREKTKDRVLESIADLNYIPNISARALAGNRTHMIGLLYGNPSAFYLSEIMVGALGEVSRLGHQLLLHKVTEIDNEDRAREELLGIIGRYDGVIVPPPLSDYESVRAFLRQNDIPAVFLSGLDGGGRSAKVCIDDYEATKEVILSLIDIGHTDIGIIQGNPNQYVSSERFRGYTDALSERGVNSREALIAPGSFTYQSGMEAAQKLLALKDRPTAIFASNDDMAAGVLAVASSLDLVVPDDLAVVGFDDSPLAKAVVPNLTTIRQPLIRMAEESIRCLLELLDNMTSIDGVAEKQVIELPYEIIWRESAPSPLKTK